MMNKAFQDYYPDDVASCYGCGHLNEHGYRIKSRWDGDEAVCKFRPEPYHTAIRGYVYGGLVASLIDCHSMGTAAAAWMRANGMEVGEVPTARFVTGSLKVDYLKPTPIGCELEIRARATEIGERKVIVDADVLADGVVTVRGHTIAVRLPDHMVPPEDREPSPK
jgi:acyl-coenzyme A thioesterase PaaI-like protein